MTNNQDKAREAFEEWCREEQGVVLELDPIGLYEPKEFAFLWLAWQAAYNLLATDNKQMAEAIHIAKATVRDAIERLKLFRDEPCDIPDIQHIAAIGVDALGRSYKRLGTIRQEDDTGKPN